MLQLEQRTDGSGEDKEKLQSDIPKDAQPVG